MFRWFFLSWIGVHGASMLSSDANVLGAEGRWPSPTAPAPCGNFSNQWVSSNGEFIYMTQVTFTLEGTDVFCANRGGRAGQNKFTTRVKTLAECVDHVKGVPECGLWFDFGQDGWCDCVQAIDGVCIPAPWQNYSTYKFSSMSKDNCTIIATNPVQRWSPMLGHINGKTLHMEHWSMAGTLSDDGGSIGWNDTNRTVWGALKAPPLEDGLEELKSMLQYAIETEQSVIQPYLAALYSIHPDTNINATKRLHDLVVEEMLHMTTAANVLNAIGGHPSMDTQNFVPVYPKMLPFVNISLGVAPFTPEQMDIFREVEEATWGPDNQYRIDTVGVFYFRIGMHLEALVKAYGEKAVYVGDPTLQVSAASSRGTVPKVDGHKDAINFLAGILMQGEGSKGSLFETSPYNGKSELPHYYRFNELRKDRCYNLGDNSTHMEDPTGSSLGINWSSVYKFSPNPKSADFKKHADIYRQMLEFNSCYTRLLAGLHSVFNGKPDTFGHQIGNMMKVGQLAKKLMTIPHPEHIGMTVGPSWEWINISSNQTPACPDLFSIV